MIRKLALLLLLPVVAGADIRYRAPDPTSVIEESMCIPELNGEGCLHVDEDVSGLIIQVYGATGALVALYDADTEIEDISAIGTYAAPSASNVRVSPQAASGADLTQMMFADAVYDSQTHVTICVSDGETTIMDFCRFVYLDGITRADIESEVDDALTAYGSGGVLDVDSFNARSTTDPATATLQADIVADIGTAQAVLDNFVFTTAGQVDATAVGGATAASLTTLDGKVDTIDDFLDTEIAAILTDTGTTLDGKLDTIDTVVDSIKTKTDSLTFTVGGQVDANIKYVHDIEVDGAGSSADPWGPAN